MQAATKVAMFTNGSNANNPAQFALFSTEAQALGMQAVQLDVRTPPDMEPAFASLTVPTALLVRADEVIE